MDLLPKGQEEVQKCKMSSSQTLISPLRRAGRWDGASSLLPVLAVGAQGRGMCLWLVLVVLAVRCLHNDVGSQNISRHFQASGMLQSE